MSAAMPLRDAGRLFVLLTAALCLIAGVVSSRGWVSQARAGTGARLYFTAPTTTVAQGAVINVPIRVDTGGDAVNVVEADFAYPNYHVELTGVDTAGSAFGSIAAEQIGGGHARLAVFTPGGTPPVSGDLLVATARFRADCTGGSVGFAFDTTSGVYRASDNANILTSSPGSSVTIGGANSARACLGPSVRGQGATNNKITITGSGFGTQTTIAFSGTGIRVASLSVSSSTRLIATISIATAASVGTRDVTVSNAGGAGVSCVACFTVTPGPTVSSTSPTTVRRGTTAGVTVNGSNYELAAKLSLGTGITISGVSPLPARITATAAVAATAPLGFHKVTVTNPDGGRASCAQCFSVTN